MKKQVFGCVLFFVVSLAIHAQAPVETPINGFLIPRATTIERTNLNNYPITTPKGTQVYDLNTESVWFWNGEVWVENSTTLNSDTTIDAWVNNVANTRLEVETLSDGTTPRAAQESFVILDNGNVGIGTLTPQDKLHVNGNIKVKDGNLIVRNGFGRFKHTNNQIRMVDTDDSNTWSLNANNSLLGIKDITNGTTPFTIYSNAPSNSLRIAANGNIGVGTSTPSQKLEVNGKIQAVDVNFSGLPVFSNDEDAITLTAGDMYRTPTGELRIKL